MRLYLGDGQPPHASYDHLTLDNCRELDLFVEREVMGRGPVVGQPVQIREQPAPGWSFFELRLEDLGAGAGGSEPDLLGPAEQLGLGAWPGGGDSLLAIDGSADGTVDLVFGNLEGEIQRVTAHADQLAPVWRSGVLGVGVFALHLEGDRLYYATQDGHLGALDLTDGHPLAAHDLGPGVRYPRGLQLGRAFDPQGDAVQLLLLTDESGALIGLDPQTLEPIYRNDTVGYAADMQLSADGSSLWLALIRGHLLRVRLLLPDCLEVQVTSPYFGRLARDLLVVGDVAVVSDRDGQHLFGADGQELQPGPLFDTRTAGPTSTTRSAWT